MRRDASVDCAAAAVPRLANANPASLRSWVSIFSTYGAFIGTVERRLAVVPLHNAAFDRNFIDFEYNRCGRAITGEARWIDTLQLAQKRFPGMPNSLDALCKRFKISLVERTLHGALIDARLLAEVYLELKGGKERVLDLTSARPGSAGAAVVAATHAARPRPLAPRSTPEERAAHLAFLKANLKDHSLWAAQGVILPQEEAA